MSGRIENLVHEDLIKLLGNRCNSDVGIAIHGTNAENVLTAAAAVYSIDGYQYTKAAAAEVDISGLSGLPIDLTAGKAAIYALSLDAAGAWTVDKGAEVAAIADAVPPSVALTKTPVALIKVTNGTASAFVIGTTAFSAASVTTTFHDISVLF